MCTRTNAPTDRPTHHVSHRMRHSRCCAERFTQTGPQVLCVKAPIIFIAHKYGINVCTKGSAVHALCDVLCHSPHVVMQPSASDQNAPTERTICQLQASTYHEIRTKSWYDGKNKKRANMQTCKYANIPSKHANL